MSKLRRLPSGKTTTDVDVYINSWRKLCAPLEKATKSTCIGFDPGILLGTTSEHRGLDLNIHYAMCLYEALTGAPYQDCEEQ